MDTNVQLFLKTHRISVVGILQENNRIHSAAMHFAFQEDPLTFYFMTGKPTMKCASLVKGADEVPASLVIGFSEEEFATFQAEGMIRFAHENDPGWDVYGEKYPARKAGKGDENTVLLKFTPTWWRYHDYKHKTPLEFSQKKEK